MHAGPDPLVRYPMKVYDGDFDSLKEFKFMKPIVAIIASLLPSLALAHR